MPQAIEELQNASYGEIVNALASLSPQVIAAREQYEALVGQERVLIAARALIGNDVRIGETVQMRGQWAGKKAPLAIVVAPSGSGKLMFQVLNKTGQPHGQPQNEYMFEGFDKL
jgi:hypothetical protein